MGPRLPVSDADMDPLGQTVVAPSASHDTAVPFSSDSSSEDAPTLVGNRYEILGLLGSGGMGTVYRARDRELDEIVALKVLKKELAAASGMLERFRREVKLARRVTHKNVARTFDIGDHDGDRFLTMELVEGEMLGAHLARRGRVPARDVVRIARDVCAGLAAAHAADVLHRDLKPENVILAADGRAVITDFGIARALAQAEMARTAAGLVGTPAYMAPEQVEGLADLDGRTDLYALGTMLFELLSGKPAWPGDSVIAIAAARILRPPPDVRSIHPNVPADLAELVLKLMARSRDDRYASAEQVGEALSQLAHAELPSGKSLMPSALVEQQARRRRKTLAVLPISNEGETDDAYLTQTLTEDLVDLLSVVPELRVRPRGETARIEARMRGADAREAGRELDVDVVVEGSLHRIGDRVRIALRAITVQDGFQLWARRFERAPGEVQSIADVGASAIAHALAAERGTSSPRACADPVAQELYLRGRYLMTRGWIAISVQGTKLLREAHERAPEDTRIAGAYALAVARVQTAGEVTPEAVEEARAIAERTLEVAPAQAEARVALAFIHLSESEVTAAAVQLMRALATAPNSVEALDAIARLLAEVGPPETAIRALERVLAIDPTVSHSQLSLARLHALIGDLETASAALGPPPAELHDFAPYMLLRARIAVWRGDADAAREVVRVFEQWPGSPSPFVRACVLGVVEVVLRREKAIGVREMLDATLPLDNRLSPRRLCFHAQIRVEAKLGMRDVEGALRDLRVGDSNGLLDLMWLDHAPIFDELRERPELIAIRESTALRADRVRRILAP